MCCLFGLIDPQHRFTGKQKCKILHALATASEVRGTDATGVAYNTQNGLCISKYPIPGHRFRFQMQDDTTVAMGHTRMTTQGDERHNQRYRDHTNQNKKSAVRVYPNGRLNLWSNICR